MQPSLQCNKIMSESPDRMSPQERRVGASLAAIFALRMLGLFIILPVFAVHAAHMPGARIDLIVIYEVVASQRVSAATRPWRVQVPGRMVDVANAEIVDQWSGGDNEFSDLPFGCVDACEANWIANRVAEVAREVGAVLAEKLAGYERKFVFQAKADGITPGVPPNLVMRAYRVPRWVGIAALAPPNRRSRDESRGWHERHRCPL